MDPILWRAVSNIAVFVGIGLTLIGGIGTAVLGRQPNPGPWWTSSVAAGLIGITLSLVGGIGTWGFGNRLAAAASYRKPILAATATVEVTVPFDGDIDRDYLDAGGYIAFGKEDKALLIMGSTRSTKRKTAEDRTSHRAVFALDVSHPGNEMPVYAIQESELVQIHFKMVPAECEVFGGSAVCTFNSTIRIEIPIPPQQITNGLIFVRDLEPAFSEFPQYTIR